MTAATESWRKMGCKVSPSCADGRKERKLANEELRIGRSSSVYRGVTEKWKTVWPIRYGKVVLGDERLPAGSLQLWTTPT